jgi:hypothetical protein
VECHHPPSDFRAPVPLHVGNLTEPSDFEHVPMCAHVCGSSQTLQNGLASKLIVKLQCGHETIKSSRSDLSRFFLAHLHDLNLSLLRNSEPLMTFIIPHTLHTHIQVAFVPFSVATVPANFLTSKGPYVFPVSSITFLAII